MKMKSFAKFFRTSFVLLVVLLALSQEVEARRKILRGRKTLTRTYMRSSAIPGWAVALIIGIVQIIIGAALYVLLKIWILDKPMQTRYHQVEPVEA